MNPSRNIFQWVLEINKLLQAFKWLLPTEEGRRQREIRRVRRKFMRGKITNEVYLQLMDELRPSSAPEEAG